MVARRWRVVINRARRHNRAAISRFDDNRRAAGVVGAEKRGILFRISGNDIRLFHQPRFKPGDLRRFAPQGQFFDRVTGKLGRGQRPDGGFVIV